MPPHVSSVSRILRALTRGVWAATRPVIRDARGRTVAIFNSRARLWRDPAGLDFPQADFERVLLRLTPGRAAVGPQNWRERYGVVSIVWLVVAVIALVNGLSGLSSGLERGAVVAGVVVLGLFMALGHRYSTRKRSRTFPAGVNELEIVAAMLAEHRCPSCAYKVTNVDPHVDPEPDGCTVCPECGAAWHIGRVRPVFSFSV